MLTRRTVIVLLAFVATFTIDAHADAGCCDWLFGRQPVPVVVNYPPAVVPTVAAPPVVTTPVVPSAPQPAMPPVTTNPINPATNGAYQTQRPAYDNPSVYTGMPVIMAPGPSRASYRLPMTTSAVPQVAPQVVVPAPVAAPVPTVSAYRPVIQAYQETQATVPLARVLRGGAAATSNPFYGTGNVYPDNYQTRYQAAYPVTDLTAPPAGTPVPAVNTAPLFPNAPPPPTPGLSRFFGSRWTTNYRSSYNSVPITYYRPVTTVDPVTGATVTVQQPCTSTVQQLQRTPYNSKFMQGATTVAPMTGSTCGSACPTVPAPNACLGSGVTTAPYSGGTTTYGGVGQASGITSPSDLNAMPIPSIDPGVSQPGTLQQPGTLPPVTLPPSTLPPSTLQQPGYTPNTQPLRGAPSTNGGDLQAVPQPRIESSRQSIDEKDEQPPVEDSYWKDRNGDETSAVDALKPTSNNPFSQLRPIEAPSDYAVPFSSHQGTANPQPSATPAAKPKVGAPPLLPVPSATFDLRGENSASLPVTVPIREATLAKSRRVVAPAPVRESGGWQAND